MTKYLIYCASWEKGEKRFDELYENVFKYLPHKKIYKKKRGSICIDTLTNDSYKVVYAYEGARGYKWNYCEVDEEISLALFHNIILPSGRHNGEDYERRVSFF